jgi:hypothetical protein
MKWRPIKTAPRDRQILLACMENGEDFYVTQGRWVDVHHSNTVHDAWRKDLSIPSHKVIESLPKPAAHWMEAHVGYMEGTLGTTYETRGGILFRPTHWMPLPEGPKSRKAWLKARKIAGQR